MPRSLALLILLASTASAAERPNVLFLFSDDQRADAVGFVDPAVKTPHLDALAARGFVFRNAYCMGSDQGAVCVASRAMLLSGRNLFRAPMKLEGEPTLPRRFADGGCDTFGVGKWHNGAASFRASFDAGGPVFFGGMGDQFSLSVSDFDPSATPPLAKRTATGTHSATLFAGAAADFLRERSAGADPFFLYVAFTVPHDPRTAGPDYAGTVDPASVALPPNFLPEHPFDNGEMAVRDEKLAATPRTPAAIRQHLADYHESITHLDHEVGRILDALEASGEQDKTLVVFASDHGLAIGSHGLMGKQNLYEHSVKAPLILAGPGVSPGSSDALVYLYDLFPTLLEAAGLPVPEGIDGRSLLPVLRGKSAGVREAVLTGYKDVQRAVRVGRWKLIVYPQAGRVQLFDLETDPHETHDLSGEAGQRERVREMVTRLVAEQRAAGDRLVISLP